MEYPLSTAKIGRNDPCPCGSTKKYKLCCLQKGPRLLQLREEVAITFVSNEPSVRKAFFDTDADIRRRQREFAATAGDDIDKTADGLLAILAELEATCRRILCRHSPVFWLLLERCIPESEPPPEMSFGETVIRSLDRVNLYPALIMKHAGWRQDDLRHRNGQLWVDPTAQDVIDFYGTINRTIVEIGSVLVWYRSVSKGARIEKNAEGGISIVRLPEMEKCSVLYGRRRSEFSTDVSPAGGLTALEITDVQEGEHTPYDQWSTLAMSFNEDKRAEVRIPQQGYISGPTFKPEFLSLAFFHRLEPFEAKVEETVGLTLDHLRLCLVALKQMLWDLYNTPQRFAFLTCAILATNLSNFKMGMQRRLRKLLSRGREQATDPKVIVEKFERVITCTEDRARNYAALQRQMPGCIFTIGSQSFFDVSLLPLVIIDIVLDLELDSDTRRIKGAHLEKYVAEHLLKDVPTISYPIRPGLRLKKKGERNPFAEVDVYAALDCLLLLIECKAYSVTRLYFAGARKAVESRWIMVNDWLNQSDVRAREIARNPEGANYTIPKGITHVVPVVCSAFPEYFWDLEERKFLVPNVTPRVCTYPELKQFLLKCSPTDMKKLPFAYRITGR